LIKAKKSLGQNFLIDDIVINEIINHVNPDSGNTFLEIGPGKGAITKELLNKVLFTHAVEIDDVLSKELSKLENKEKFQLHNQNILDFDPSKLSHEKLRVIGNLPYNISTEIIFKMCDCKNVIDMHFMLQKEVVDRLVSEPNSKVYGRLSVMAQAYFDIHKLFDISENVFSPKPKVKSSFVRLEPKKNVFDSKHHETIFYDIVKSAFETRRKMIRTSLSSYLKDDDFLALKIEDKLRAENLTVNNFLQISEYVQEI